MRQLLDRINDQARAWWPVAVSAVAVAIIAVLGVVADLVLDERNYFAGEQARDRRQDDAIADVLEQLQATADDTNELVTLLEGRTPLFGTLQATENRAVCISELNAQVLAAVVTGLAAVATDNDQALVRAAEAAGAAREQLLLLGTPEDPCSSPGG